MPGWFGQRARAAVATLALAPVAALAYTSSAWLAFGHTCVALCATLSVLAPRAAFLAAPSVVSLVVRPLVALVPVALALAAGTGTALGAQQRAGEPVRDAYTCTGVDALGAAFGCAITWMYYMRTDREDAPVSRGPGAVVLSLVTPATAWCAGAGAVLVTLISAGKELPLAAVCAVECAMAALARRLVR